MKNRFTTFLAFGSLVMALGFSGCGSDDEDKPAPAYTCTTCNNTPEAKAEHDNTSKGIYKGVVVGSTGNIKFDIQNTGGTPTATLKLDGQTITLTTTDTIVPGQAYNPTFTGTHNGQQYSISFAVQANGSAPVVTAYSIPGHPNTNFQLAKETSNVLIKVFEGTTSGQKNDGTPQSGTLNIVLNTGTNRWTAVSQSAGQSSGNIVSGTMTGNTVNCDCGPTTVVTGTLNGDQISGTYQGSDNSGTWSAQRSL